MAGTSLRTPLGRVRGLGAAKDGVHQWWLQRLTAIALVPLVFWFAASIISLAGAGHKEVAAWLANPLAALLMLLLILAGFWHLKLGMQVVIEDYVHGKSVKITCLVLNTFACLLVGGASALAVLKLLFGG